MWHTLVPIPPAGKRPKDGLKPKRLLKAQGIRIDPAEKKTYHLKIRVQELTASYQYQIPNLVEIL